jgi:hypothetical protein
MYAMEYYSAKKKNEIMSFVGQWMELEITMLSEISQAQKPDIACSRSFVEPRPKMRMVRTVSGHECIWGFSGGRNSGRGRGKGRDAEG